MYEVFHYLGFMEQVVPLSVVYPDKYFEGKIPQGNNRNIESVDEQLNP